MMKGIGIGDGGGGGGGGERPNLSIMIFAPKSHGTAKGGEGRGFVEKRRNTHSSLSLPEYIFLGEGRGQLTGAEK